MFSVSENALKQLEKQLSTTDASAIEVAIKKSGCSGYRYYIDLCKEMTEAYTILVDTPVKVVTLTTNLPFLKNVSLDYIQEGLNRSFKFSNPDAKSECGCGESFML